MSSVHNLALRWYELFNQHADDLYPGRYTYGFCLTLAELAEEITAKAREKNSTIVAHNYLFPEFHELADHVGDSLGLALTVRDSGAQRVDFQSVEFMGETAKLINGDNTRVFVQDTPEQLGCSLVFGTDHAWIEKWKEDNPDGVVITYVNSDAYTKALSDYVCTSANTDKILAHAMKLNPGKRVLLLPDKYLGYVMVAKAAEEFGINPFLVDVYTHEHNGCEAACYVHAKIGKDTPERMLKLYPDADLLIHPECGCANSCLLKVKQGVIPHGRAYFLSTSQMITAAQQSSAPRLVVATEKGMIYRLKKEVPDKVFIPVSDDAQCKYMKRNTFEGLLRSLQEDRHEIIICDDCCDPKNPVVDEQFIHIPRSTAQKAKVGITRMMEIT